MRPAYLSISVLLLALSACGGDKDEAEGERKTAAGEVLGGSISDDMLPLDTVQSQSPPLRESSIAGNGEEADDAADDKADAPRPAASPEASSVPEATASASATPTAED